MSIFRHIQELGREEAQRRSALGLPLPPTVKPPGIGKEVIPENEREVRGWVRIPSPDKRVVRSPSVPRVSDLVRVPPASEIGPVLLGPVKAASGVINGISGAFGGAVTLMKWSPLIALGLAGAWAYGQVKQ